jgi:hypothetical protein
MLNGSTRLCDLCASEIPEGAKYRVTIVPKEQADFFRDLLERVSGLEMTPTTTVDPAGNNPNGCLLGVPPESGTDSGYGNREPESEEGCSMGGKMPRRTSATRPR